MLLSTVENCYHKTACKRNLSSIIRPQQVEALKDVHVSNVSQSPSDSWPVPVLSRPHPASQ